MIAWTHKSPPAEPHPIEPHHDSTGHWVCYKCREPINDNGAAILMTAVRGFDVFAAPQTPDADQPNLSVEGS